MPRINLFAYLRYALFVVFATCFAIPAEAAPFPTPVGFVTDTANLINPADRNSLESELKALEQQTTWEFWVVTIPTLDGATIERYAQDFFAQNGIGKKGKDNGVLLLLARQERKVRIHTGFHAESVIPDVVAKRIIRNTIAPKTKADDWSGGLLDGAHEVIRLIRAEHEHPGQAAATARQNADTIFGMSPGLFIFLLICGFILFVLLIAWVKNGRSGGYYGGYYSGGGSSYSSSSSSGGGFFSGGGGDCGGGGASGDC